MTISSKEAIALPFIDAAILLDQAKQRNDIDLMVGTLDSAISLWFDTKCNIDQESNKTTVDFMDKAIKFMMRATLINEPNDSLLDHLVSLNFNMSEMILQSA